MSSTTIVSLSLSELAEKVLALEARIALLESSPPAKSAAKAAGKAEKTKKVRDPTAPKRPANEWVKFTNRVASLLKSNGYVGVDVSTHCRQFCRSLKGENDAYSTWTDADILARRAAWTLPAISEQKKKDASAANSVVSAPEKAVSVASEKKKPGRKGKKAAAAPAVATAAPAAPAEKKKGGRKAKKVTEAEPVSNAAAAAATVTETVTEAVATSASVAEPVAAEPPVPESKFEKIRLQGGKPYLVNFATGHAYHRLADDSQGEWAGMFVKVPKPHIDDSVAEPAAEEESAGYTVE